MFPSEWLTAWCSKSFRQLSSSELRDHNPGLPGTRRSASTAAFRESWGPRPYAVDVWTANIESAICGGRSTASVGSMMSSTKRSRGVVWLLVFRASLLRSSFSASFAAVARSSIRSRSTTTLLAGWGGRGSVGEPRGCCCARSNIPDADGMSEVVRRIGPAPSTAGGLPGTGDAGFDFDFPNLKKSKKPPLAGLPFFTASVGFGEREKGVGFAWAGGRK